MSRDREHIGSAIFRGTDCGVHINAGAEIGVASTKAYTCQIVALVILALALSEDSLSRAHRRKETMQSLLELPNQVRKALELDKQMLSLAAELKEEYRLLLFGRGYNYATALEVKEVALCTARVFWRARWNTDLWRWLIKPCRLSWRGTTTS